MKFNSFSFFKKNKSQDKKPANKGDSDITNEINGLIILSIGFLLFLAILSYEKGDITYATVSENNLYQAKNWLGIVGATVAKPIFEYTFGYASLVFPFILMLLGIFMMIDDHPARKKFRSIALIGLGWAYWGSIALVIKNILNTNGITSILEFYPSGAIGGFTAQYIHGYLGRFALVFISSVFLLILLMLTFQFRLSIFPLFVIRQIQKGINWLSATLTDMFTRFKDLRFFPEKKEEEFEEDLEFEEAPEAPEEPEVVEASEEPAKPPTSKSRRRVSILGVPLDENENLDPDSDIKVESAHMETPEEADDVLNFSDFEDIPLEEQQQPPEPPTEEDLEASFADSEFNESPPPSGTEIILPEEPPVAIPIPDPVDFDTPVNGDQPAETTKEQLDLFQEDVDMSVPEAKDTSGVEYDRAVEAAMVKYKMPPLDILHEDATETKVSRDELMANADLLENTLAQFNVKAHVKKVIEGPVITLYAVRPAEGVKISQIVNLSDDLALAMRAKGIRMIAPIPGEAAIGIEIPNRRPSMVYFKSVVKSEKFSQHNGQLSIGMGKTIGGEVFCADLSRMPHLLIAGATGAGKSVGINTIIASILYRVPPSDVKFVMIDPKKLELSLYAKLRDHYLAVCPDIDEIVVTHPQNAVLILRSVVNEMEARYDTLAKVGVRDIISYNRKLEKLEASGEKTDDMRRLPYIVVIIDELADLILTASREVEEPITRLAQMARAVGIHLIVATQRPSVDILTGLIKANFPTRIAYQVATRPDSKVILDMYGAEKLIGNGDLLFLPPGTGKPVRLQNPYISTEEVDAMIQHIKKQPKFPPYELKLVRDKGPIGKEAEKKMQQDDLFEKAKEIVIRHQQGSVSLLQRKLKIGYARAGRLMDGLEEAGVVGPGQGSKAREVLISSYGDE